MPPYGHFTELCIYDIKEQRAGLYIWDLEISTLMPGRRLEHRVSGQQDDPESQRNAQICGGEGPAHH